MDSYYPKARHIVLAVIIGAAGGYGYAYVLKAINDLLVGG